MSPAYMSSSWSETRLPSIEGWAGSGRPTTVVGVDACKDAPGATSTPHERLVERSTTMTDDHLARTVQRLADEQAVRDLGHRFADACNRDDADAFRALWTDQTPLPEADRARPGRRAGETP
jgi:hypothetical protein